MSRFAPLSLDDVFENVDTTPRRSSAAPTRPPSVARQISPTPTLLPVMIPPEYEYNGHAYNTLEEVISASARDLHIHDNYVNWMKNVVDSVVMSHLTQTYNTLGNKIYEHKQRHEAEMKELQDRTDARMQSLEKALLEQMAINDSLSKDLEVLNNNNGVLISSL